MAPGNITIRKSKSLYVILSVLFTGFVAYLFLGPYEKTRIILYENPYMGIPLYLLLSCAAAYSLYSVFDNKAVITFSREGITHKKKIIPWGNIKGYKTVENPSDNMTTVTLILILKTIPQEYKIDLLGLSTSETHIRHCIKTFSDQSIIDEGHSTRN